MAFVFVAFIQDTQSQVGTSGRPKLGMRPAGHGRGVSSRRPAPLPTATRTMGGSSKEKGALGAGSPVSNGMNESSIWRGENTFHKTISKSVSPPLPHLERNSVHMSSSSQKAFTHHMVISNVLHSSRSPWISMDCHAFPFIKIFDKNSLHG